MTRARKEDDEPEGLEIRHAAVNRRERLKALGLERVLVIDRGNLELALPAGWAVERDTRTT